MSRIPMIISGEPAVYRVMSRTAHEGYVMGNLEKKFLFRLKKNEPCLLRRGAGILLNRQPFSPSGENAVGRFL